MHIDPRFARPYDDKLAPPGSRTLPTLAFALCSVLAMAGTVLLGQCGVVVPECGVDPAAACVGP